LKSAASDSQNKTDSFSIDPHPGQDAFHRAGGRKYRMVRCGNRYGKSTMGAAEDVAWLKGERVWLPKNDPARYIGIPQRPVKGLVITTDWDKVDEIWTSERGDQPGKIWRFLAKGEVKSKKRNHSGAIEQIELNNGSVLRFDTVESFKKNPMASESSDWDFTSCGDGESVRVRCQDAGCPC